jgi:hypothetical protein
MQQSSSTYSNWETERQKERSKHKIYPPGWAPWLILTERISVPDQARQKVRDNSS